MVAILGAVQFSLHAGALPVPALADASLLHGQDAVPHLVHGSHQVQRSRPDLSTYCQANFDETPSQSKK